MKKLNIRLNFHILEDEVERDVDITDLKIYSDYFDDPQLEVHDLDRKRLRRPQTLDIDEDYYEQEMDSAPLLSSQHSATSTDSSLLQI